MKNFEITFHTFDNQPHIFFGKNAMITSEFTGKNWGARDQNLINRKNSEYSNAIVHAFQGFRAPFSGKIVHIFPEQSAAFN